MAPHQGRSLTYRARFSNGHSKFRAYPQPESGRRNNTRAQDPIIETITDLDIYPKRPPTCDQPNYSEKPGQGVIGDQHDTSIGKNTQSDTSGTSNSSYETTPAGRFPVSRLVNDGTATHHVVVEHAATDILSAFFVNPGSKNHSKLSNMVVYCSYSFLAISNVFYIPA